MPDTKRLAAMNLPYLQEQSPRLLRFVCSAQGWFYVVSGIWPLVSPYSFQIITGFKVDFWLAQTVGALLAVTGAVLVLAARAGRITREIALIAAGQACVLGVVDLYCVALPGTTRAYWLDAVVEFGLVTTWLAGWWSARRHARR